MSEPSTHLDGTPCPEGTQRLSPERTTCCDAFHARTLACYFDVRYEWWPNPSGWFIIICPDAGGGGIAINNCPHCGARLHGPQRSGRWMELD